MSAPLTMEQAAGQTAVAMTFRFERFRASPGAGNYVDLQAWMLAHQRLLTDIRGHYREPLLADLARTPITDWPACIAAVPDL